MGEDGGLLLYGFVGNGPVGGCDALELTVTPGARLRPQKAIKLLTGYRRLAEKLGICLSESRLQMMDATRQQAAAAACACPCRSQPGSSPNFPHPYVSPRCPSALQPGSPAMPAPASIQPEPADGIGAIPDERVAGAAVPHRVRGTLADSAGPPGAGPPGP